MDLKKRLRNPFVQQYVVEIIFPLVGYFFFDWTIFIIGVYYVVDHLAAQLLLLRRLNWMRKHQSGNHLPLLINGLAGLVLIAIETAVLVYLIQLTQKQSIEQIYEAFMDFLQNELWLLFPLLLLVYHFKDQFTFYMPRHYLQVSYEKRAYYSTVGLLAIVLLLIIGGVAWFYIAFSNVIAIFVFLIIKVGYDLTIKQWIDKRTKLSK